MELAGVSKTKPAARDQFGVRRQRECDALSALPATPLWITAERRCLQEQDGLGGYSVNIGAKIAQLKAPGPHMAV